MKLNRPAAIILALGALALTGCQAAVESAAEPAAATTPAEQPQRLDLGLPTVPTAETTAAAAATSSARATTVAPQTATSSPTSSAPAVASAPMTTSAPTTVAVDPGVCDPLVDTDCGTDAPFGLPPADPCFREDPECYDEPMDLGPCFLDDGTATDCPWYVDEHGVVRPWPTQPSA